MMIPVNLPAEIHFGRGIRSRLVKALPPGPVLFIAGKHSRSRIETEVIPLLEGREFRLFSGVSPEPPLEEVEQARELGREIGAVSVVGWGGGSAIDVAKASRFCSPAPEPSPITFMDAVPFPGKELSSRRCPPPPEPARNSRPTRYCATRAPTSSSRCAAATCSPTSR